MIVTLLIYFLKVNLLLAFVFVFYYLFLRRETYVNTIRWYFNLGMLLSFILPTIFWTREIIVEREAIDFDELLASSLSSALQESEVVSSSFSWDEYLLWLYVLISLIFISLLCYRAIRLMHRVSRLPQSSFGSYIHIDMQAIDAYSFIGHIVLPANYKELDRLDLVLLHEEIHLAEKHSFDMLFVSIVRAICWINPFVWMLQKSINLNLEYIVDQKVSRTCDSYEYQSALVRFQYQKIEETPIINAFQSSDLKKRIIMLNKQKSTIMKRVKFLLIAPFITAFFGLFQVEVKAKVIELPTSDYSTDQRPQEVKVSHVRNTPQVLDVEEVSNEPQFKQVKSEGVEIRTVHTNATSKGVVIKEEKNVRKQYVSNNQEKVEGNKGGEEKGEPIYIVDGIELTKEEVMRINATSIEKMAVLKGHRAVARYGEQAKDGAILIITKKTDNETANRRRDLFRKELEESRENSIALRKERIEKRKEALTVDLEKFEAEHQARVDEYKLEAAARKEEHQLRRQELQEERQAYKEAVESRKEEIKEMRKERIKVQNQNRKERIDFRDLDRVMREAEIQKKVKERNRKLEEDSAKRRKENAERLKAMEGKGAASTKERKTDMSKIIHVVDGKFYDSEEFMAQGKTTKDIKKVKVYNKEDAKAKFNYTGEKTIFEYTFKTEEDIKRIEKVAELTKRYKERINAIELVE